MGEGGDAGSLHGWCAGSLHGWDLLTRGLSDVPGHSQQASNGHVCGMVRMDDHGWTDAQIHEYLDLNMNTRCAVYHEYE